MRIVDNLETTTVCPNCGKDHLLNIQHDNEQFKYCTACRERIYEADNEAFATHSPAYILKAKEKAEREELLMDARDLLHDLPLFARTQNELDTLNQIANLFDKILTLLEREE